MCMKISIELYGQDMKITKWIWEHQREDQTEFKSYMLRGGVKLTRGLNGSVTNFLSFNSEKKRDHFLMSLFYLILTGWIIYWGVLSLLVTRCSCDSISLVGDMGLLHWNLYFLNCSICFVAWIWLRMEI